MNEKFKHKSKDTKKILKVSDCKLMHLREEGVLGFVKKGNAFLYNDDDVKKYKKLISKNKK